MLDDDLRQAIVDAQREAESANEKLKLERMLEDHKKKNTSRPPVSVQFQVRLYCLDQARRKRGYDGRQQRRRER